VDAGTDACTLIEELIAPTFVEFYDEAWNEIGSKLSLCEKISEVTSIDPAVLLGFDPTKCTVAERMSWAASRSTTRIEDAAYSLMGLFKVFMPMLYGEGNRAFTRLQEEIMKQTEDYTIFAWKASFLNGRHRGILAHSPDEFLEHANIISRYSEADHGHEHPPAINSRGLLINLPLLRQPSTDNRYLARVCVLKPEPGGTLPQENAILCIWLKELPTKPKKFVRIFPGTLERLPETHTDLFTQKEEEKTKAIYVLPYGTVTDSETSQIMKPRSGKILVSVPQDAGLQLLSVPSVGPCSSHSDIEWKYEGSNELLYSYHAETCSLAALTLMKKNEDQFVVFLGFRNHLPWCSIITLDELDKATKELGFPKDYQWKRPEVIRKLFDNDNFTRLHLNYTDRSSKRLPNRSNATASLRVACPTPLSPPVFNLHVRHDNLSMKAD